MATSLLNHGCGLFSGLDRVAVRLIATAYVVHALVTMRAAALPLCVWAALTVLAYLFFPPCLHFTVHVLAVLGILEYIRIRSRFLVI